MNKSNIKNRSRRAFLADCGKMSSIGAMSSVLNMTMTNKILAARSPGSITDFKALVCIYLEGGADTYQMLQPGLAGYAAYTERRQHFALNQADQHRIVDHRNSNRDCHVYQMMPEVAKMFEDQDLAFVANVGTLVEPLTRTQYINKTKKIPLGVGSHFDQGTQWQTSISDRRGASLGWMGRMADVINDSANNNGIVSMNLSLTKSGSNYQQQGSKVGPFSIGDGANPMELYNDSSAVNTIVNNQLESEYTSLLKQHYNHIKKTAIEQGQAIAELEKNTTLDTVFPEDNLGIYLRQVAKYIKINGFLGLNRQTFFVKVPGFDMHTGLLGRISFQFEKISKGLNAFNEAMKEIGYHDKVVTYTASDFGRSLSSNGSGNDHAWGSNQIVMGGPVKGGRIVGEYSDHTKGSKTDLGERGKQLPQISVDELHASLAKWFGVNNDYEMEEMLPNIRNFYAAGSDEYAIENLFT